MYITELLYLAFNKAVLLEISAVECDRDPVGGSVQHGCHASQIVETIWTRLRRTPRSEHRSAAQFAYAQVFHFSE